MYFSRTLSFFNDFNVGQAIDALRSKDSLPEDFYDIYLVDNENSVTGVVPLGRIMSSSRKTLLQNIKNVDTRVIKVSTDQEEVAYLFNKLSNSQS